MGREAFPEIRPLLGLFPYARMGDDAWQELLFGHARKEGAPCGYAMRAGARTVGFVAAQFADRILGGRMEPVCNLASWVVEAEHRGASVLLMRKLVRDLDGITLVGQTPVPTTVEVFTRLGFRHHERESLVLFPGPCVALGSAFGATQDGGDGSVTTGAGIPASGLAPEERRYLADLVLCPRIATVLLRSGDEHCLLVARRERLKVFPWWRTIQSAELLYVGNRGLFWKMRARAHRALMRELGCLALSIDARWAPAGRVAGAVRVERERLYRPAHDGIDPVELDGLYSELVALPE